MTNAPKNPRAFPRVELSRPQRDTGSTMHTGHLGMTLRDYFAGQALAALAGKNHGNDWGPDGQEHGPICARKAYRIADAMLEARGEQS